MIQCRDTPLSRVPQVLNLPTNRCPHMSSNGRMVGDITIKILSLPPARQRSIARPVLSPLIGPPFSLPPPLLLFRSRPLPSHLIITSPLPFSVPPRHEAGDGLDVPGCAPAPQLLSQQGRETEPEQRVWLPKEYGRPRRGELGSPGRARRGSVAWSGS